MSGIRECGTETSLRHSGTLSLRAMHTAAPGNVAGDVHRLLNALASPGLPCFPVPAGAMRLLHSPAEFHAELVRGARVARRRVCLASLYLGDGPLELRQYQTG